MPRHCSVAGCKSNYDGGQTVPTFTLPKNPELRRKWLRKIPTDLSKLKYPNICMNHFDESVIIRIDRVFYKGEFKEYPCVRPKLAENALPTIFPNCPSYLSSQVPNVRRLEDVEKENLETALKNSVESFKNYVTKQSIHSFDNLLAYVDKGLPENWIKYIKNEKLYLCFINVEDYPLISASIIVDEHLNVTVFVDKCRIKVKKPTLESFNELDDIIKYVSETVNVPKSKVVFQSLIDSLKETEQYKDCDSIQFCIEQIELTEVEKHGRRYNNQTMILASCLFIYSPSAYHALLKSNLLILPHPRNLRKLIHNFNLSLSSFSGSTAYLENRIKYLQPKELIVSLILDEIYIQPQLTFKGGQIFGNSSTDQSQLAKTVQVFMISSIFSKYKDVVTLVPVNNLTSEYLKDLILSLICSLENMGFKVISLVSDNNCVNRKAFELLTNNKILQHKIPHPFDSSRTLFFIFDTVHILKCVRNNWSNKRNENRSIKFLDINTNNILAAQYYHLEQMFEIEKSSLLKYGHTLSAKVLYPSSIQKQNVNLALKLFNENNVTALKHVAQNNPLIFNSIEPTCIFLETFIKWWKIVNVKNPCEGRRFNDKYREPIRRDSTEQLDFLRVMSVWLKNWRQTVPISDALSAQTFQALITTIDTFLDIIPYVFEMYDIQYVLLGKFQSDNLESRFSKYRQLSGANYYITYMQVLENERKLRFKNTVLFCSRHKDITLSTLMPLNDKENISNVNLDSFHDIIEQSFNSDSIPDTILPILVVIGGYSVRNILNKKKCQKCISWLQLDKTVEVDLNESYSFLKDIDRGKLIMPTEIVVDAAGVTWDTMNKLINSENSIISNYLCVLHKISCIKIERTNSVLLHEECFCGITLFKKMTAVSLTISKILINNYIKSINDKQSINSNSARKIKKLKA